MIFGFGKRSDDADEEEDDDQEVDYVLFQGALNGREANLGADKADAMVVPARLDGLERTPFTRLTSAQSRRSLFPKVVVTFLPPRKLNVDPGLFGRKRRQADGKVNHDRRRQFGATEH